MGGVIYFAECIAKALPEYQAGTDPVLIDGVAWRMHQHNGWMICITMSTCAYLLQDTGSLTNLYRVLILVLYTL